MTFNLVFGAIKNGSVEDLYRDYKSGCPLTSHPSLSARIEDKVARPVLAVADITIHALIGAAHGILGLLAIPYRYVKEEYVSLPQVPHEIGFERAKKHFKVAAAKTFTLFCKGLCALGLAPIAEKMDYLLYICTKEEKVTYNHPPADYARMKAHASPEHKYANLEDAHALINKNSQGQPS